MINVKIFQALCILKNQISIKSFEAFKTSQIMKFTSVLKAKNKKLSEIFMSYFQFAFFRNRFQLHIKTNDHQNALQAEIIMK